MAVLVGVNDTPLCDRDMAVATVRLPLSPPPHVFSRLKVAIVDMFVPRCRLFAYIDQLKLRKFFLPVLDQNIIAFKIEAYSTALSGEVEVLEVFPILMHVRCPFVLLLGFLLFTSDRDTELRHIFSILGIRINRNSRIHI